MLNTEAAHFDLIKSYHSIIHLIVNDFPCIRIYLIMWAVIFQISSFEHLLCEYYYGEYSVTIPVHYYIPAINWVFFIHHLVLLIQVICSLKKSRYTRRVHVTVSYNPSWLFHIFFTCNKKAPIIMEIFMPHILCTPRIMKDITPDAKFRFHFTTLFLTELLAFIHRFYEKYEAYFFSSQMFVKLAIC